MKFKDIFKSSFMEKISDFSALDMGIALGLAFLIGLFIFYVYKKTFRGIMYSAGFGVSLMAMSMITTMILLAVTSNVVLSLGMVGALSIVRFRTAVKEPLDIAFLFWAISVGIVLGAGMIPLAILGSLFIGIVLLLFVNKKTPETPYILMVSYVGAEQEEEILKHIGSNVKRYAVKSKTVSSDGTELTLDVRLKEMSAAFVNSLSSLNGVKNVLLVSYNGDYVS
jgi:uncharacterized membrane protein YhiD involved in acid resistance